MRRFIRNRKGTAEVIGTLLFVIILFFFFTNVYLWHDQVVKESNNFYLEKVNSAVTLAIQSTSPFELVVNNTGGEATTLSVLWIDENGGNHFAINQSVAGVVVDPQSSYTINLAYVFPSPPSVCVDFKVVTEVGNFASCEYSTPA